MKVKIKFFGRITEITGQADMEWDTVEDTDALIKDLLITFPGLKNIKYLVAVNRKIAATNHKLEETSEVAFLPPFSGG